MTLTVILTGGQASTTCNQLHLPKVGQGRPHPGWSPCHGQLRARSYVAHDLYVGEHSPVAEYPPTVHDSIESLRRLSVGVVTMTRSGHDLRGQTQPRRGLRRVEAAIYVGISGTKFDEMVRDGRLPKPKRIDGATVWDLHRLDLAFDALPDDGNSDANPWG